MAASPSPAAGTAVGPDGAAARPQASKKRRPRAHLHRRRVGCRRASNAGAVRAPRPRSPLPRSCRRVRHRDCGHPQRAAQVPAAPKQHRGQATERRAPGRASNANAAAAIDEPRHRTGSRSLARSRSRHRDHRSLLVADSRPPLPPPPPATRPVAPRSGVARGVEPSHRRQPAASPARPRARLPPGLLQL